MFYEDILQRLDAAKKLEQECNHVLELCTRGNIAEAEPTELYITLERVNDDRREAIHLFSETLAICDFDDTSFEIQSALCTHICEHAAREKKNPTYENDKEAQKKLFNLMRYFSESTPHLELKARVETSTITTAFINRMNNQPEIIN